MTANSRGRRFSRWSLRTRYATSTTPRSRSRTFRAVRAADQMSTQVSYGLAGSKTSTHYRRRVAVSLSIHTGDRSAPTTDLPSSPGYIYLGSHTATHLERDYRTIRCWESSDLYTT